MSEDNDMRLILHSALHAAMKIPLNVGDPGTRLRALEAVHSATIAAETARQRLVALAKQAMTEAAMEDEE